MIIHKCDRCKEEIDSRLVVNEIAICKALPISYELCDNCMQKLDRFLKNIEESEGVE